MSPIVIRVSPRVSVVLSNEKARGARAFFTNRLRRSATRGLFQLRRRLEAQTPGWLNLDCFARLWIAPDPCAAFRYPKRAKGPDLIRSAVALCRFESCLNSIEHKFDVAL